MTTPDALRTAARHLLGPCTLEAVLGPAVVRVATGPGRQYVVKQHATRSKHEREVHAYRRWTAALGASAPSLVAADDPQLIIIISAQPGHVRTGDLPPAVHRQAGTLLRLFHDAEPPRSLPSYRHWLTARAAYWTTRATAFLSPADAATITRHLAALAALDTPPGRPCHLDFQPRNWLISTSGHVWLIDFEHARIDLPARDLTRLRFRIWAARPDLRDAFLAGYGHPLTQAEDQLIWHLGALDALTALARGNQAHDPQLTAAARATIRQLAAAQP